jgi:hypothetical protein
MILLTTRVITLVVFLLIIFRGLLLSVISYVVYGGSKVVPVHARESPLYMRL